MGRSLLGVLAGLVVGMVLVALVETLGMRLIPPPPGMDPTDPASIAAAMRHLPTGSFLFVLAAWFLGAGVGTSTAMRFARSDARWPGLVVGGVILAATLYNLWTIPHPVWVAAVGVAGIIVITLAAARPRGAAAGPGE
jgi:hypothetical protein